MGPLLIVDGNAECLVCLYKAQEDSALCLTLLKYGNQSSCWSKQIIMFSIATNSNSFATQYFKLWILLIYQIIQIWNIRNYPIPKIYKWESTFQLLPRSALVARNFITFVNYLKAMINKFTILISIYLYGFLNERQR